MPRPRRRRSFFANFDVALITQDWLTALTVWVFLEILSFVLLPWFQLLNEENKYVTWFVASVPLGLLGAFLIGLSSEFIQRCHENLTPRDNKQLLIAIGQIGSGLGLAGVLFPVLIVALELWVKLTKPVAL